MKWPLTKVLMQIAKCSADLISAAPKLRRSIVADVGNALGPVADKEPIKSGAFNRNSARRVER